MTNNLKEILLKIVRLPKTDQGWIMSQLSKAQKTVFSQVQGEQHLQNARRFRKLKNDAKLSPLKLPSVPLYHRLLANYCPLYIAIILEQGQFSWQEQFLELFDHNDNLKNLLNSHHLRALKITTKQALFKQWESSASFETHLERNHG
jgi:hypothetical protein